MFSLGTLGPLLYIFMNHNMTSVQAHLHRCSVAKELKAAEAIQNIEKQGILKKVTEPIAQISNSFYRVKPDGSLRVCIEPSQLNIAIEVPKYPFPTVDELLPKLRNFQTFFLYGPVQTIRYHHPRGELFIFNYHAYTLIGRYRWLRMPFGVSLVQEENQRRQHSL